MLGIQMWREAHFHQIVEDEVEVNGLPHSFDGSAILFVSDLHRRKLRQRDLEPLMDQVDWVMVGGDVAEKGISWSTVRHNMKLLTDIAPTFAVYGNHDKRAGAAQLTRIFQETGVELLQDKVVSLHQGDSEINLAGMDYRSGQLSKLLMEQDIKKCTIVLIHDPLQANRIQEYADLVLSGHTHGGQLVIPFLGPIFLNKAYRSVSHGWYTFNRGNGLPDGNLLVSRGYGTNHLPLRLCCPAEMHKITLKSDKPKQP
ncbi:metallophosphoesterase [Paenibacillus xylanilyticus]|uniref:metallophosphoesterase n=1 Tax=Paenibacillus xylanilyticus TaxID=248903 RepID=UPI0039A03D23